MIPLGVLAGQAAPVTFATLAGIRFYGGPPSGSNGSNISTWTDESSAGNDATTGTTKPTVLTNATPNGASAVDFSANTFSGSMALARFLTWSTAPLSGTDDGEMWLVIKRVQDNQGAWTFGTCTNASHFTYGGVIYDSFGGTTRLSATGSTVNTWHVYRATQVGNTLTATLDGSALFSGSSTKGWATNQYLGISRVGSDSPFDFRGYIAACVLRDRQSTTGEATVIRNHLSTVTGV